MSTNEIAEILFKWLSSIFPTNIIRFEDGIIKVYEVEDGYSIGYKNVLIIAYCIIAECDKGMSECYKGIGRCIAHCVENGFVPTYITVPENCPHIKKLERIINAINLPIGLISVSSSGEVKTITKLHLP